LRDDKDNIEKAGDDLIIAIEKAKFNCSNKAFCLKEKASNVHMLKEDIKRL
jgi:hypothetical protein